MSKLANKLEKPVFYFFAGLSVMVVFLGISRAKQTEALAVRPSPDQGGSKETNDNAGTANGLASNTQTSGLTANVLGAESKAAPVNQIITVKGAAYQTPWGNVSAKIKVKDGKIVTVDIPELPDSPPSIYAQPYLIEQAVSAGSANIQGVSGATITSKAFRSSLENALASARRQAAAQSAGANSVQANINTTTQTHPVASTHTTSTKTNKPSLLASVISALTPTLSSTQSNTNNTTSSTPKAGVSGTFTGAPSQTPWGNAVASITLTDGKITAATMPSVPNSQPSIDAAPKLVSQTVAAGGANIQGVSGATITSNAFKLSLENAIAQANKAASAQGATTSISGSTGAGSTIINNYYYTNSSSSGSTGSTSSTATPKAGVSGTFTGASFSIPYGGAGTDSVAVSITLAGGKITNVTMPKVPNSQPSIDAKPILIAQAMAAGSANIQGVSGATLTSNAFRSSLESAITLANAAAAAQGTTSSIPASTGNSNTSSGSTGATSSGSTSTTGTNTSTGTGSTAPVVAPNPGVSGTFTGMAVQIPYGGAANSVVASIVLQGGKITKVTMPSIPNSGPSIQAAPILVAQAMAAGNSNIQGVTNATFTSNAFRTSLENAIALANAAASAQGTTNSIPAATTPAATTPMPVVTVGDDD